MEEDLTFPKWLRYNFGNELLYATIREIMYGVDTIVNTVRYDMDYGGEGEIISLSERLLNYGMSMNIIRIIRDTYKKTNKYSVQYPNTRDEHIRFIYLYCPDKMDVLLKHLDVYWAAYMNYKRGKSEDEDIEKVRDKIRIIEAEYSNNTWNKKITRKDKAILRSKRRTQRVKIKLRKEALSSNSNYGYGY